MNSTAAVPRRIFSTDLFLFGARSSVHLAPSCNVVGWHRRIGIQPGWRLHD
jgi:hypothetical protein